MKKRQKMNRKKSKKLFKKTASKTHGKNIRTTKPMRGGYRL